MGTDPFGYQHFSKCYFVFHRKKKKKEMHTSLILLIVPTVYTISSCRMTFSHHFIKLIFTPLRKKQSIHLLPLRDSLYLRDCCSALKTDLSHRYRQAPLSITASLLKVPARITDSAEREHIVELEISHYRCFICQTDPFPTPWMQSWQTEQEISVPWMRAYQSLTYLLRMPVKSQTLTQKIGYMSDNG